MTAKKKSLAEKLAEVAAECGYVKKGSSNDYHGYKYASAEDVLRKVNKALTDRKIAVSSAATVVARSEDLKNVIAKITLGFHDGDDPTATPLYVEGLGQGSDKGDKATMKANTAALKYAYANALTISWGDDPEKDTSTDEAADKPKKAPAKKAAPKKAKDKPAVKQGDDDLLPAIEKAETPKDLEEIKPQVIALRNKDKEKYEKARDAWKAKQEKLTNMKGAQ